MRELNSLVSMLVNSASNTLSATANTVTPYISASSKAAKIVTASFGAFILGMGVSDICLLGGINLERLMDDRCGITLQPLLGNPLYIGKFQAQACQRLSEKTFDVAQDEVIVISKVLLGCAIAYSAFNMLEKSFAVGKTAASLEKRTAVLEV
jgi:hypothetical protein